MIAAGSRSHKNSFLATWTFWISAIVLNGLFENKIIIKIVLSIKFYYIFLHYFNYVLDYSNGKIGAQSQYKVVIYKTPRLNNLNKNP
jgi:hypothetical protein